MPAANALDNAAQLRDRMLFLEETRTVFARLQTLMREIRFTGKQVHDANIVATALCHGVERVVTANTAHYGPASRSSSRSSSSSAYAVAGTGDEPCNNT